MMDDNMMAPYRAICVALLEQSIKDAQNGKPDVREAAIRWLWQDVFCEELCDSLGYDPAAIREALEHRVGIVPDPTSTELNIDEVLV